MGGSVCLSACWLIEHICTPLYTIAHKCTQFFIVTWFAHSSTLVMFHLCTFPSNVVPAYICSIICVEMSYHRSLMHGWLILCRPVQWTEFVYTCTVGCVCAQFALSLHTVAHSCTQLHTLGLSASDKFNLSNSQEPPSAWYWSTFEFLSLVIISQKIGPDSRVSNILCQLWINLLWSCCRGFPC